MRLLAFATLLVLLASGCASPPPLTVDPAASLLVPGEPIRLRVPADLMHGHDMEEPPYGEDGYNVGHDNGEFEGSEDHRNFEAWRGMAKRND